MQTPQQKSKKKRLVSQSLQSSEKSVGKLEDSGSGLGGHGDTKKAGQKEEKTDQEIIKKFIETKLYNKIEDNFHLNNKKALFLNMRNYYEAIG